MLTSKYLLNLLKNYKKIIIYITLLTIIIASIYLYFTPYIYRAYTIIEVKDSKSNIGENDILLSALTGYRTNGVNKEIEILKTFEINRYVLDKIDFTIRYFIRDRYKKKEFYKNSPIKIENLVIYNKDIFNKDIYLYPQENGKYKLSIDRDKSFNFNEDIKTTYFKMRVKKLSLIKKTIIFKINADKKMIYDKIITPNLHIKKVSKNVPLIKISYSDNIPQRATDYVNSLAESFLLNSIKGKSEQNSKIIKFINEELDKTQKKLKKAEKNIELYQISHKIINPSTQANSIIDRLSQIELKLADNQLKKKLIKNIINFTKSNNNLDAISPLLKALDDKPTLKLIDILQNNEIKAQELSNEYTLKHPKIIEIMNKIRDIRKKIISNIKNIEIAINQESRNLNSYKFKYEQELKSLPKKEKHLVNMKRDYEVNSKIYNYLLEKKSENEIIKVAILSDYNIIEKAYLPQQPVTPKIATYLIVAFVSGILLSIFIILTLNKFNSKIISRYDINSKSDLKIYTVLPYITNRQDIEIFKNSNSTFSINLKRLVNRLEFLSKKNSSTIILNLSMVNGEGKTSISINLGAMLELMQYRVVIIDFNILNPKLSKIFNLKENIGLGTYLSGGHKIYEIIQHTNYKNLDIITLGLTPKNPSKLILSDRLPKLLDELKIMGYDYIIIDTAPIELVYSTLYLMEYSDINFIIFRAKLSKKEYVDEFDKIIKEHQVKNVAFLLNAYED